MLESLTTLDNCTAHSNLPASQLSLPSTPEEGTQKFDTRKTYNLPPLVITAMQTSKPIVGEQHVHNERGRSPDLLYEVCHRSRSLSLTDRSRARKTAIRKQSLSKNLLTRTKYIMVRHTRFQKLCRF